KFSNPDGAQVVIDDIIWTAYSGDSDGDCAATVPFTESFENHDDSDNDTFLSGCWTQEQLQGANWILNNSITDDNRGPRTGEWDIYLAYGAETWIFHPIQLEENIDYTLSFYAVESNTLGAEVTASYGTTGDSEAMTNEIITTTQIGEDGYQKVSGNFTVSESGIYYIGIKGQLQGGF